MSEQAGRRVHGPGCGVRVRLVRETESGCRRRWCSDACRMKSYRAHARRGPIPMVGLDALVYETAETLLNAIKESAAKTSVPRHLLSLAQAYALVVAPGSAPAPAQIDDSD